MATKKEIIEFLEKYATKTHWVPSENGIPKSEPLANKPRVIFISKVDKSYLCDAQFYELAKALIKYGITDDIHSTSGKKGTSNVGYSPGNQKWFGWSHRAMFGFGIGDKLFVENFKGKTPETPFNQHGTHTIKTMEEARKAARNFAKYIG